MLVWLPETFFGQSAAVPQRLGTPWTATNILRSTTDFPGREGAA
jgi:hypothetical protein